jgi:type I restriction enzyme S subunit
MSKVMTLMNDLIDLISMGPFGSDIKVDNFIDDGVPVLNGLNVASIKLIETSFKYVSPEKAVSLKKANAKRGDIVITHRGTVGQISYIPENSKYDNYIISQSQFRVTLKRDIVDPIYFTYYFHTEEGQKRLLSFKSHVGVPALAQATTNFRLLEFPLIPLKNQQKIAKVLSDLDAKIELNNKINAELEAMAKLIYDYWFVQFDFPNEEGKPYKSSGGKMFWNEELKKEVPQGWEVMSVVDLLAKDESTKKISSSDYLDIGKFPIIDQSTKFICGFTNDVDAVITVVEPRIIFGDHTRILKLINFDFARGADGTQIILSNNPRVPQHYFFYSLKKIDLSNYGYARHFKFLKDSKVIVSTQEVAKEFEKNAKRWHNQISLNINENQKLAELRDWLLPMLMNGQVRIDKLSEPEKHFSMAAEEREKNR